MGMVSFGWFSESDDVVDARIGKSGAHYPAWAKLRKEISDMI